MNHIYAAIDLKTFYASVECRERGFDPLTTNLVVADKSRTEKTICLAVSPSLKAYGIPGRCRLFEVNQKIKEINRERLKKAPHHRFTGESYDDNELKQNPSLKLTYITAVPRMAFYIDYSTKVYNIFLQYIDQRDIHIYSIDEAFFDLTSYLDIYNMKPDELVRNIIKDISVNLGITATAGIGDNLYLAKVALDIVAKHKEADKYGVRIATLDEMSYRHLLWDHTPLTDFWRVGHGYQRKLADYGLYTMGDIALCSLENEDLLYKLFGINAELLIDHAWGYESCTMEAIKNYQPSSKSLGAGQVLHRPYNKTEGEIIVKEMVEQLSLDLIEKGYLTDQLVLTIGYDHSNNPKNHEVKNDYYGRPTIKHAHGTVHLDYPTTSQKLILKKVLELYNQKVEDHLFIRRVNIAAVHLIKKEDYKQQTKYEQLDLFSDYDQKEKEREKEKADLKKEEQLQKTLLEIKKKYGKSSVIKAMDLQEGATAIDRNNQIGGHKA